MKRQEKRRLARKKTVTHNITNDQIKAIQDFAYKQASKEFDKRWIERRREAVNEAFAMFIYVPLLTARDHLGFGKKRLLNFAKEMIQLYNDWDQQKMNSWDILQHLRDETGLDIELSVDCKNQSTNIILNEIEEPEEDPMINEFCNELKKLMEI